MNARTMKRSIRKAKGLTLSAGPAKGTTGKEKGPARITAGALGSDQRGANAIMRAAREVEAAQQKAA